MRRFGMDSRNRVQMSRRGKGERVVRRTLFAWAKRTHEGDVRPDERNPGANLVFAIRGEHRLGRISIITSQTVFLRSPEDRP